MQQGRKLQWQVEPDYVDEEEIQREQAQDSINVPRQLGNLFGSKYDPANLHSDFSTGNENIEALIRFKCVKGSSQVPCGWSKITCAQLNLGSWNNRFWALLSGLSQNSIMRSFTVKKPIDGATPILARFQGLATDIETVEIVFVRKLPADCLPDNQDGGGFDNGGGGAGGSRRGGCGRRSCYGRCDRCRRRRGDFDEIAELFPFRQAMLYYTLYVSRIVAFNTVAGEQCRSKPVGDNGCGAGCGGYPSSLDPQTWGGSPGITNGPGWHVNGTGPNFPDRARYHGFGPLAEDQMNIQFASMRSHVEIRHPLNGCYFVNSTDVVVS